jgi:hypothetical protein
LNAANLTSSDNYGDVYAVIRKCENIDEQTFTTLETYVDNNSDAEETLDKF